MTRHRAAHITRDIAANGAAAAEPATAQPPENCRPAFARAARERPAPRPARTQFRRAHFPRHRTPCHRPPHAAAPAHPSRRMCAQPPVRARIIRSIHALLTVTAALLLVVAPWGAGYATAYAQPPVKRIGYLEAGPFWLYTRTWDAFRAAMAREGGLRCEFPQDARFSPGWEPENMRTLPEKAAQLMRRKDLDLVVGMGTAAVKALLAANDGRTPIIGMGMADPVAAGVVKDAQDSGVDNLTTRVTVDRWSSMFRVFHDVVRFRKMGVMYPDTPEGRVYAALGDAEAIAAELGFSLVRYGGLSSAETTDECRKGLEALREQGMDAFFIGPLNCFDIGGDGLATLLDTLAAWKMPTFARDGSEYVKAGALMGFSTWNFAPIGEFHALQARAILTGGTPRALSMLDKSEPSIALNLATAKAIGFEFPFDVLVAADELHETVTRPAPSDTR